MDDPQTAVPPQGEQEPTPETKEEEVVEPANKDLEDKLNKEIEARKQLTARAKKAENEKATLEARLKASKNTLDVEDYIDISAALEGLDQKEKEKISREHKLTGKPLGEIRKDEDFLLWQKAYREKVEKETKTLAPTSTQINEDKPKTLLEKLKDAKSIDEKEKFLQEAGFGGRRIQRNPNAGKVKF